jgi:nitroreductase/NAD-dependent dihydropyrimidine dehydrogenase PreA subunit
MINIDSKKCIQCGTCAAVCPALVIEMKNNTAVFVHPKSCWACWHCVAVCPSDAVTCSEFPLESFKPVGKATFPSPAAMRNLLLARRSVREFKDKPVPRGLLEEFVITASHAPTGHNSQCTEISVITDRERINSLDARIMRQYEMLLSLFDNPVSKAAAGFAGGKKAFEMLMTFREDIKRYRLAGAPAKHHILRGAPALMVAHAGPAAVNGKDDCVIALTHVMFDAMAHGLGATWMGYLAGAAMISPAIKKSLGVPMINLVHAAIILGWPKYSYKRFIPRKTARVTWIE